MGQPAGAAAQGMLLTRSSPSVTSQPSPPRAFGFHHQRVSHQPASATSAAAAALTAGRVSVGRLSTLSAFSYSCRGDFLMATTSGFTTTDVARRPRSSPWRPAGEFGRGCSAGQKLGQNGPLTSSRGRHVMTMALPIDAYWITAAEAVTVAGLMGGIAVVTGIFINIRIEVQALAEFKELEAKGLLPDEITVPDGDFDLEAPLYIFQNKEFSSAGTSRNRPIREEFQPELEKEVKTELVETTSKE